jgi:hypothetical protein
MLAGRLPSGALACGLLGAGHRLIAAGSAAAP